MHGFRKPEKSESKLSRHSTSSCGGRFWGWRPFKLPFDERY